MPTCRQCPSFDAVKSVCTVDEKYHPRSAVRNCVTTIARIEIPKVAGKRLLEVGAGVWKEPRWLCKTNKVEWNGVDPRWKTDEKARRYHGTASNIPFPDNYFELVLAFETMEHWHEKGDNIPAGLKEIHRVLTPGGKVVITVPIHLHGGDQFVRGDIGNILSNFLPEMWTVEHHAWRREHDPLPVHTGWLNNRARGHFIPLVEEGFKNQSVQKTPSSWSLNINATKK